MIAGFFVVKTDMDGSINIGRDDNIKARRTTYLPNLSSIAEKSWPTNTRDEDSGKGAVEQDQPGQETNVSRTGEIGHRNQDALLKSSDSDFPEPGQNEETLGRATRAQPAQPRYRNRL